MPGAQTGKTFEVNDKKQMLILVRYKPAAAMDADSMLGGITSKVQGAVDAVENAANSIPGLSLFFKEEKEPEKKTDKEYNYFNDYKDWDAYMKKMKDELPNKLNMDNETLAFDFDVADAQGREREGKKLANQVKSKISDWKDYTACFHFVGIGHGGNVANECIKELVKESDFKKKWWVQSVIYIGTPLYKNLHAIDEELAFRGKGKSYHYGNSYDLTQNVIEYIEPKEDLLKMIAESNANTLSIFTGKIKAQLVATLGRLLTIKGFGTSHDNKGNIDKLVQCKEDVRGLVSECVDAVKAIFDAAPSLIKIPDLPKFDQMLQGYDKIPSAAVSRLEDFIDELKNVKQGTSLDTSRINVAKVFNFLCPLVDNITNSLKLLAIQEQTAQQAFDKIIGKACVKKLLAPKKVSVKALPVDPYIAKVIEMAEQAKANYNTASNQEQSAAQVLYDQSTAMINKCKGTIEELTKKGDLDVNKLSPQEQQKVGELITCLLLPMMPTKKKFYGTLLNYLPLDGLNGFLAKITADQAFSPLKGLMSNIKGDFDFDEGTKQQPGLKVSIQNLNAELDRIKGFFRKSDFPIHKDANSLYFIYNSHNLMLKKPYGEILNTIDKETGYLDIMQSNGYINTFNLEENKYQGGGEAKNNVQPAKVIPEEEKS